MPGINRTSGKIFSCNGSGCGGSRRLDGLKHAPADFLGIDLQDFYTFFDGFLVGFTHFSRGRGGRGGRSNIESLLLDKPCHDGRLFMGQVSISFRKYRTGGEVINEALNHGITSALRWWPNANGEARNGAHRRRSRRIIRIGNLRVFDHSVVIVPSPLLPCSHAWVENRERNGWNGAENGDEAEIARAG
ncbi:hypothetical protein HPP92_023681 [Vanilla planifolia]|uniref:Uncharacterized protein n=1 Tax=Vanilla planifolia TaxID=51239 RepID=A0A835PRX7_VANPL|nr:hypothetical protein HPP92_023681 [Vanilla planifolia]